MRYGTDMGPLVLAAALFASAAATALQGDENAAEVEETGPATRAARKILDLIDRIESAVQETRYQHRMVVRRSEGLFAWDCSGMAAWILRRTAPRAFEAVGKNRPVAATFARTIARAPVGRTRNGWRRLAHIEDARPGDVFAWKRPKDWRSKSTGHVGFLVEAPRPVPGVEGAYTIRVADATSLPHQDDTRAHRGPGGFGYGTILVLVDEDGRGIAYGWFGTDSGGVLHTPILFGRVWG